MTAIFAHRRWRSDTGSTTGFVAQAQWAARSALGPAELLVV
jgi:hypothetical protein